MIKPHMTDQELQLFHEHIVDVKHYYEYGMGGSTVYMHEHTTATIDSVDCSAVWIERVTKFLMNSKRLTPVHVDIGPIRMWGYPTDQSKKHNWPEYSSCINKSTHVPDVVLIDGRFRVACIANTILYALNHDVDPTIILHDAGRSKYTPGMELLRLIDSTDQLHVYKLDCQDHRRIQHVLDTHKYDIS